MAKTLISNFLLFFCSLFLLFAHSFADKNELSCEYNAPDASGYVCNNIASENQCNTYAFLYTNPYYSSLYNLSFYLGLNRLSVAEANGFSAETEFLPRNQPLLIPIECKCAVGGHFQAALVKNSEKGENFYGIAESLEGLTTCKALKERNVGISPWNLPEKIKVNVPVRCACPTSSDISSGIRMFVSYPVIAGDHSATALASQFNITPEAILNANKKEGHAAADSLLSILIPLKEKPLLGPLAIPREPTLGYPSQRSVEAASTRKKKKKKKMKLVGVCVGVIGIVVLAGIAGAAAFILMRKRKEQQRSILSSKMVDVELQQLNMSIRTTSEKKVSFEGSQSTCTVEGQALEPTTPRNRVMLENYSVEELKKATEDFASHNLIEGNMYHGCLKGKNLAIKCTTSDYISEVELTLFQDAIHNHPNIIRVLGTCITDGPDSYLVFEYAKNGSLKDWIHGGLAMKSHFISSCYCFLTWRQRLRICLDVALALQYMHHIMHPVYVHRNIKTRNIFLDEEFNAKLGNFGMSKCVVDDTEEDPEFSLRNPASWSKGYLAPECIKHGAVSTSIDIFAYGVILLEVLSGETPVTCPRDGEIVMLSDKIKSILQSESADELRAWIDTDLCENYSFEGAISLANLARACVDDDASIRPSAGEIVEELSRLLEESPEDQRFLINESCSKPLVRAAASNTR